MKAEPEFDLIRFLQEAHRLHLRCMLIGRWAVAQHGAPVVTADYDFWIHPKDRLKALKLLESLFNAEVPDLKKRSRPLVRAFVGPDQIDVFFLRRITNRDGEELLFDNVYARSEEKVDPDKRFRVRIPCIDDLIALKKFDSPDPLKRERNLEDIRFLQTLKNKKRR